MGMPMNCHTEMNESAIRAGPSNPSQGWYRSARPNQPMMVSATPHNGLRINSQMKPTMTTESMVGRKKIVRKKPAPRVMRMVSSAASRSPIEFCTIMWMMKKMTLCLNAPHKRGCHSSSVNSVM